MFFFCFFYYRLCIETKANSASNHEGNLAMSLSGLPLTYIEGPERKFAVGLLHQKALCSQ